MVNTVRAYLCSAAVTPDRGHAGVDRPGRLLAAGLVEEDRDKVSDRAVFDTAVVAIYRPLDARGG